MNSPSLSSDGVRSSSRSTPLDNAQGVSAMHYPQRSQLAGGSSSQPEVGAQQVGLPDGWSRYAERGLTSPGGTDYPNAIRSSRKRDKDEERALGRLLNDAQAQNISDPQLQTALGKGSSFVHNLNTSLPEALRRPKMSRQESGRKGGTSTKHALAQRYSERSNLAQPSAVPPNHLSQHREQILSWSGQGHSAVTIAEHLTRNGVPATPEEVRAVIQANPQAGSSRTLPDSSGKS